MVWDANAPQGNESAKIKYEIVPYTRGRVLELGSGPWRTYPHFITVDNITEWGNNWRPDIISDAIDLSMFASQSCDCVFSSHLLEHIDDTESALKEWWRVIRHGGYLVLYLPHKDYYPNIGDDGANPDHIHDFKPSDIIKAMKNVGNWDLLVSESRNQGDEYSFLQVFKKGGKGFKFSYFDEKPIKTCAVVRYGGFGDMIQITPVLRSIKDLGYHITLYTTQYAYEAIKFDSNIDEFVIQDKDQVPNIELFDFWETLKENYDKFVNFSETVEGAFLALEGRPPFYWSNEARHMYMNHNYEEFAHAIAGVEMKYSPVYTETIKEAEWSDRQRRKIGGGKLIMFVLAGSSVHKSYPHMDQVIARILTERSDVSFVFVGNESCQLLESPWREEPRILRKSGKWTIRQTMSMAKRCDLVIGPETGVLNAVSHESVPKIINLSHSSPENLTKHWKNCTALEPENCLCHPCHKMVYGFAHCERDEAWGTAKCQANIDPEDMIKAIERYLE